MSTSNSVLIVNVFDLNKLPPVINLIDVLTRNGKKVTVVTFDTRNIRDRFVGKADFCVLDPKMLSFTQYFSRKKQLRALVGDLMKTHDVLWTTTDRTARELGPKLFEYKHVMQLMELIEDMPMFPGQNFIKAQLYKYARKAYKVVVPEFNRAWILKTWWRLDDVPTVLPNKPSTMNVNAGSPEVARYMDILKNAGKKIVIYQGIIRKERPMEPFAKAIEKLKDEFCFCIMGGSAEDPEIRMLLDNYSCVIHIPFVSPPEHLNITSLAHIGIMSYVPDMDNKLHYSKLNAVYCAPNKIYEYAGFGVPVIGNDVPGVRIPLSSYQMGIACSEFTEEAIVAAIKEIDAQYDTYSRNAKRFFTDTDLDDIVINKILG